MMKRSLTTICLCFLGFFNAYSQQRFISVDNTQIWVSTIGLEERKEGQPVVVFESGLGTPMDHWDRIIPGVTELAPIVTYDRPGIGKSEPIDQMPTNKNVADRLIKILDELEVAPPYVLVGHSLGGVYVRGFAVYYPDLLAGLVIIDPADFTETKENQRDYYEGLGWEQDKVDSLINSYVQRREKRRQSAPRSIQLEGRALVDMRESSFEEFKNNPLPNIPVHIITGGRFDLPKALRSQEFDEEAVFRTKMKYRVARWTDVIQTVEKGMLFYSADAGHFVHYDDPELVVSSIKIVLKDYDEMIAK